MIIVILTCYLFLLRIFRRTKKNIRRLNVSMHYFQIMHRSKTMHCFYKYTPNLRFFKEHFSFSLFLNHLEQVSFVCMLHNNAISDSKTKTTYQRVEVDGSKKASLYAITFGCLILARILISFIALSRSFSLIVVILTVLRA